MQPIAQRGWTAEEILDELRMKRGTNHLSFRYDVLDADLNYLKPATNILDCTISNQYLGQIKRTARMKIVDDGTINFLSNKIKPWVQLHMPGPDPNEPQNFEDLLTAIPNGVFRYKLDDPGFLTTASYGERSGDSSLGVSQITVPLPRSDGTPLWQDGDVALMIVAINTTAVFDTTPSGWTTQISHTSGSFRVGIFFREAMTQDVVDPTITWTGELKVSAAVVILRNTDMRLGFFGDDFSEASRDGVSSFDLVLPEVTTVDSGQLVIGLVADKSSTSTTVSIAGMNSLIQSFASGPGSVSASIFAETIEEIGNTGSRTATWDVESGSAYGRLVAIGNISNVVAINSFSSGPDYNGIIVSNAGPTMPGQAPLLGGGGSSYQFSRSLSQRVSVLGAEDLFTDVDELTLVCWAKSDAIGVTREILGSTTIAVGDGDLGFDLFFNSTNNTIKFELQTTEGLISYTSAINVQKTSVMNLIVTWKSEEGIALYIDGVKDVPSAVDYTNDIGTFSPGADFVIGSGPVGVDLGFATHWDGKIDDVSVFTYQVDDITARKIYLAGNKLAMYQDEPIAEWPQGVFVLATPKRNTDRTMAILRDVEAYDQLQVLADDLIDTRVVAVSGDNYIDVVDGLLGDLPSNLTPTTKVLRRTREWEIGTPKLQIANELIDSINYGSLFFDEHGVAQAEPYVLPGDRAVEHTYQDDLDSVILPEVTHEFDLFANANKWVLLVSDPDSPALKYVLVNDDPASPTSTVARGRTITDFRTLTDIPDLATLQEKAELYASNANEVWETIEWSSPIMPFHSIYDVYKFRFLALNLEEKYLETSWDFQCKAGSVMRHSCRRIVKLTLSEVP